MKTENNIQSSLDRLSAGIQKTLDEIADGEDPLSMLGYDKDYVQSLANAYLAGDDNSLILFECAGCGHQHYFELDSPPGGNEHCPYCEICSAKLENYGQHPD